MTKITKAAEVLKLEPEVEQLDEAEWDDLDVHVGAGASPPSPIKVGMVALGRSGSAPRLSMAIDNALLDALGGKTNRYRVRLSKKMDRLAIEPDGDIEATECPGVMKGVRKSIIRPAHNERLPACRIKGEAAAFEEHHKRLIVILPAWAHDEHARSEAERLADIDDMLRARKAAKARHDKDDTRHGPPIAPPPGPRPGDLRRPAPVSDMTARAKLVEPARPGIGAEHRALSRQTGYQGPE